MGKFFLRALVAGGVFAIFTLLLFGSGKNLDVTMNRIALEEQGFEGFVRGASPEEILLLEQYGLEAMLAERCFPGKALLLWSRFGETEEWQGIVRRYGHTQVVPVVWRFWSQSSITFTGKRVAAIAVRKTVGFAKAILAFARGEPAPVSAESIPPMKLTSVERGWEAVCRIQESGNNFLGRYEIDVAGVAHTQYLRTGIAMAEELVVGGIETLERKHALSERIKASEAAIATLEAVSLTAMGFGICRKLARATLGEKLAAEEVFAASKSAKSHAVLARLACRFPRSFALRAAKLGTIGFGVWVIAHHPSVLHGGFGLCAEMLGLPEWFGCLVGWTLLVAGAALAVKVLFGPLLMFLCKIIGS
jgi:hypothetical protein